MPGWRNGKRGRLLTVYDKQSPMVVNTLTNIEGSTPSPGTKCIKYLIKLQKNMVNLY